MEITDAVLSEWERVACSEEGYLHHIASQLISEVRRLRHELADPRYIYAGGRVPRQSVIHRNEIIEKLEQEIKALRAKQ
jgi:hypothetical protein